jgi:hypothetical protein
MLTQLGKALVLQVQLRLLRFFCAFIFQSATKVTLHLLFRLHFAISINITSLLFSSPGSRLSSL